MILAEIELGSPIAHNIVCYRVKRGRTARGRGLACVEVELN